VPVPPQTPDVATVLQDDDFKQLPINEKNKVLLQIDPDYKGLPAAEQAKALKFIHYGPDPATPSKTKSAATSGALGFASGISGLPESTTPIADTVKSMTQKPSTLRLLDPTGGAISGVIDMGRRAYGAGKEVVQGIERKDPDEIAHGAGSVLGQGAQLLIGRKAPEAEGSGLPARSKILEKVPGTEAYRTRVGTKEIGEALKIPSSPEAVSLAKAKGQATGMDLSRDLDLVKNDLAEIERRTPVNIKGPDGSFQRAQNTFDYARDLWERGHKEPIARHESMVLDKQHGMPYNLQDELMKAGNEILSPEAKEADQAGGRAAERWLQGMNKPRTLLSADKLLRELNSDLASPAAEDRYGNLMLRVKGAVAMKIRESIETGLEAAGEQGVRSVNMRYTALQNVATQMAEQAAGEWVKAGRAGPFPPWMRTYMFMHPSLQGITGSLGAGVSGYHMFETKPSTVLARGLKTLAKTSAKPEPIKAPDYVGQKPAGLLPRPGQTSADRGANMPPPGGLRGATRGLTEVGPRPKPPTTSRALITEPPPRREGLARIPGRNYDPTLGTKAPGGPKTGLPPRPTPMREHSTDLARIPGRSYSNAPSAAVRIPPSGYSDPSVKGSPTPEVESHVAGLVRAGKLSRGEVMRMVRKGVLGQGAAARIFRAAGGAKEAGMQPPPPPETEK
jgi:hypothetical protein